MGRARTSELEQALGDYDGRHHDVLKELVERFEPNAVTLRRAMRLAVHEDARIAQGASYLFWSWVSQGARPTKKLVAELAEMLGSVHNKWSRLHFVRCVPVLQIAAAQLPAFLAFLAACQQAPLPFLRAWTLDAWCALADQHEVCAEQARAALESAQDDEAASVRKRLAKILTGR